MPAWTSRTPWRTFSGVGGLMRPSSSSSPQSPHVDPGGRSFHRFVTISPSGPTACAAPNVLEAEVENWLVEWGHVDALQGREQLLVGALGEEAIDDSVEVGYVTLEPLVQPHVLEASRVQALLLSRNVRKVLRRDRRPSWIVGLPYFRWRGCHRILTLRESSHRPDLHEGLLRSQRPEAVRRGAAVHGQHEVVR